MDIQSRNEHKVGLILGIVLVIVLVIAFGMLLLGAVIRTTCLMMSLNLAGYREPVLVAHGVPDVNDVSVLRLVRTGKIALFMTPWPDPQTLPANPPLTAATPLASPPDSTEAAAYRIKAMAGDIESARKLGRLYYLGRGVPLNFPEALKWFKIAASKGDAYAEDKMGEIARDEYIKSGDDTKPLTWFQKAADQGLADAKDNITFLYFWGEGVPNDKDLADQKAKDAIPGLQKSADEGDPEALADLGDFYVYGVGFPTNYDKALSLYQKAADQGDANGQDAVGFMYEGGLGVKQDVPTAVEWYRKAAAQGLPDAQIALKQLGY
jgi:TPR repeat protein